MSERTRDLHRFLTFVDACVAIAVTLLVLPLAEAAADIEGGVSLHDFLDEHLDHFAAFALSFAVIAIVWLGHHAYLGKVAALDSRIVFWSLAWTFTMVLMPFPTALIGTYGTDPGMVAGYVGVLLASSLCMTGLCVHVSRNPSLWKEGLTADDLSPLHSMATTLIYAVALLLGVLVPGVNYLALALLAATGPVVKLLRAAGR